MLGQDGYPLGGDGEAAKGIVQVFHVSDKASHECEIAVKKIEFGHSMLL